MQQKLLISACLLGQPVRYDGASKKLNDQRQRNWLQQLQHNQQLVVICPEVAGGLPVPRPPAEIVADRVITQQQVDVTDAFNKGAHAALDLCLQHNIKFALLKARSPSCGNEEIYSGQFNGNLIPGMGVTTKLLNENGITVYSEEQLPALMQDWQQSS